MRQDIRPDSIDDTDNFGLCGILDVSEFHHHRINPSEVFALERSNMNGIEKLRVKPEGMFLETGETASRGP